MKNKQAKRMMVDVEKFISVKNGNNKCDKSMWIDWLDGPCLITSGANFIWLCDGVISLTADQHKAIK